MWHRQIYFVYIRSNLLYFIRMYVCMYVCDLSSPTDRRSRSSSSSLGEFFCPPAGSVFRPIYWLTDAKQIKWSLTVGFFDLTTRAHRIAACMDTLTEYTNMHMTWWNFDGRRVSRLYMYSRRRESASSLPPGVNRPTSISQCARIGCIPCNWA